MKYLILRILIFMVLEYCKAPGTTNGRRRYINAYLFYLFILLILTNISAMLFFFYFVMFFHPIRSLLLFLVRVVEPAGY